MSYTIHIEGGTEDLPAVTAEARTFAKNLDGVAAATLVDGEGTTTDLLESAHDDEPGETATEGTGVTKAETVEP